MEKKIYYSQSEALEAALDLKKENPHYSVLSGKTLDLDYNVEESETFNELVKNWAGEVSAYEVLDEKGQPLAKFGYWDTESVEFARTRRDVNGAVAVWNADAFVVEGESIEDVAKFICREDVVEWILRENEVEDEYWETILKRLDLKVGETTIVHVFRLHDEETLVLCYASDLLK